MFKVVIIKCICQLSMQKLNKKYVAKKHIKKISSYSKEKGAKMTDKQKLTKEQLYLLAMNALLTEANDQLHDTLYGESDAEQAKEIAANTLEEFWEITDKNSLMEIINWLHSGGHRMNFTTDIADGTISDPEEWPEHIDAWDFCRVMSLARWGAAAGYITDEEAWTQMRISANYLETKFSSFKELGENYIHGYEYWFDEAVNDDIDEAFDWLLDEENKESPWINIEWGYYSKNK